MEGNKDESERCIRLAEKYLSEKSFKKAYRFAQKAHQLYPTEKTKTLIDDAKILTERFQNEEENSQANKENFANDKKSDGPSNDQDTRSVDYIKNCKDYYEILSVPKNATETEIKNQYRKLALKFHPDKNKSPGADEAFKAIGNAFAVLSDPDKRQRYDQIGSQENFEGVRRKRRSNGFDYTRGFEEEFNPEEIFNMFFGGGFPSRNVYVYRNGHMYQQRSTNESQGSSGYTVLLQIMPILLFVCISLLSNFVPDNPYSLSRSHKYPYQRTTENLQVPYFVKENFERDYKDSLKQVESHVEESYVSNLQSSCFKERNYKENMIYRAKFLRDTNLEQKARGLKTPSCDRLIQIQQSTSYY